MSDKQIAGMEDFLDTMTILKEEDRVESVSNLQIIRPLGTSERFYWLYDQIMCRHFSIMVEIKKKVSIGSLRSAISMAISNHPLLRVKIKAGPGNHLDFVMLPVEEAINTISIINESSVSVHDQVIEEINTQFAPQGFPLMRSRIIHTSEETSSIIFTFHHSITDAIGAVFLVRKVFECLLLESSDRTAVITESLTTISEAQESLFPAKYLGLRLSLRVIKGLFVRRLIKKRTRKAAHLVPIGRLDFQRNIDMIRLEFDVSQTEMILKICRKNTVTVNGFLCASFLLSVIEEFETVDGHDKKDIALPMVTAVNMRRFLREPACIKNTPGMFASILETTHILNKSTDILDLAHEISESVTESLERGSAHIFLKLLSFLKRRLTPDENGKNYVIRLMSSGTYGPFVTNLGAIDPPQTSYENPITSISFTTSPVANFPVLLAASSWNNRLSINITYDVSVINQEKANRIVDDMTQRLTKFN